MPKSEKVEYEYGNSLWLPLLAMVTVFFSVGLVTVTVMMYLDLHNLDETDARLNREIQSLQQKLESTRMDGRLPVSSVNDEETVADRRDVDINDADRKHKRIQPQNFLEAIIQAQESIFEKYCHKLNSTCPAGTLGTKGVRGDTGSPGLKGVSGTMGIKGVRGDSGPAGFKGPVGDKGIAGPRGLAGSQGPTGLRGLKGEPGPTGRPGSTGLAGSKGSKGPKGDIGLTGQHGLPGAYGLKGQKGDTGDTGYQGPKGDVGPQGTKGNDTEKLGDRCECIRFTGPYSNVTSVSSSGTRQTSIAPTTILATTTSSKPRTTTISHKPTQCAICSGPISICERLHHEKTCEYPDNLCLNHIVNKDSGSRTVDRRCSNHQLCSRESLLGSSGSNRCKTFEQANIYTLGFECYYCCTEDNCNVPLRPDQSTLM